MKKTARWTAARLYLVLVLVLVGSACGKKGRPLPPIPRGPQAARNVTARQLGQQARVTFKLPDPRGPAPAQRAIRVELLRVTYAPGLEPSKGLDSFVRRGEVVARLEGDPLPRGGRIELIDEGLGALEDGGVGWTLRYAVRIRDRRGRASPLAAAGPLVVEAGQAAPEIVSAEPTADGIRLTWRGPPGSDGLTYNVYRSTSRQAWSETPLNAEPLSVNELLDEGVETGTVCFYSVRVALAAERPYREGEPSATVEVVAEDRFAPLPPRGLVAVQEGAMVRLFWDPSPERDLGGYKIFRSVDGAPWVGVGPLPVEQSQFIDAEVEVGRRLSYRVTAIDRAETPNESEPSAEVELELLQEPTVSGGNER